MTEEKDSHGESSAASGSTDQEAKAPAKPARLSSSGMALGVAALVLAVAAASMAGYLWYEVQVEQKLSQNRSITDIKDTVNTSKAAVAALEKEIDALREQQRDLDARVENQLTNRLATLQSRQEALDDRSEALSSSIEEIYNELDRSLESWALEEVEQLLRIANQSLRLSGDISTAVAGLELADQRLEELANPAFLEVRERLADNITSLSSLERVDVAGLALRLSGMAARVRDLPLAQKTERPISGGAGSQDQDASGETVSGNGDPSRWLTAGGEILRDLKQLVRIQNIEEPAKPLLTPEQRYFLSSNLRLMLSGAQIAALSKDTATFRENLEQAGQWIREYFDTDHQGVQSFLNELDDMSGVELSPELPDISDSLLALRQSKNRIEAQ